MREPTEWAEEDLRRLITDGVTESLTLDYKAAAALKAKTEGIKNEISKDVSAFANSAGGVIVYGMTESGHVPDTIDGLDPATVSREWLEQVISSRIQRRIEGVRINQVALANGRVVYVVVIPQSDRAPHMAYDHRFYKRFEFQSVPMEEYEVRDVTNRAEGPRLEVAGSLVTPAVQLSFENDEAEHSQPTLLSLSITNESVIPAEHAVVHLYVDSRIKQAPPGFTGRQELRITLPNIGSFDVTRWQLNWGVPGKMPIWQDMNFSLFDGQYNIRLPRGEGSYALAWTVRAPRMEEVSGGGLLLVDQNNVLSMVGLKITF